MEARVVAGKYRIVELIAHRDSSTVYRAEQLASGKLVALKVLPPEAATSAVADDNPFELETETSRDLVTRFEREARLAAAADPRHVAQVVEAGIDPADHAPFVAMELLEGQDLGALLREKGALPVDLALRIAGQALIGMSAVHRARIVHRDLKPSNLFLAEQPDGSVVVKTLDTGIAEVQSQPLATMEGGTLAMGDAGVKVDAPEYMSPEQIERPRSADMRSDVWSLGVILYKCLAGRAPYDGLETSQLSKVLLAVLTQPAPPLRSVAPWVSPKVAEVVQRALERDPKKRYASAPEMLEALKPLVPQGIALTKADIRSITDAERAASPTAAEDAAAATIRQKAADDQAAKVRSQEAAIKAARPTFAKKVRSFFVRGNPQLLLAIRIVTALLAFAAIGFVVRLSIVANALPPALGLEAPVEGFSSGRAHEELVRIAGSNVPRPVGSVEATRVHDLLLQRLRALGYTPEEQNALQCRGGMGCTYVRNVLARTKVPDASGMVLLVSHYDSVAAGPGAGDDGSGVAVALEAARAILAKKPDAGDRSIGFLFDEGEEAGLFGAAAFVDQHPWMKDVRAVVNCDARGTHGNSLLFEVIGDSDAVMARAADVLPRPWASSLLAAVYSRMPNDTDLTMFRRHGGVSGANLAFLEGVTRYHTAGDTIDALDPATLQAQGDNALALVRGFASPSFAPAAVSESTFFDVLHRRVLRADVTVTWGVSAAALIVALVAAFRLPNTLGRLIPALGWMLGAILFSGALATGMGVLFAHTTALPAPFVADPRMLIAAFVCVVVLTVTFMADLAMRNPYKYPRDPERVSAAAWIIYALLGAAAAFFAPGAAYVFALPALVASLARAVLPRSGHLPEIAGGALLAVLATPIALLLYDALGFGLPAAFAVPVALFLLPFSPMAHAASRVVAGLALVGAVVASAIALRTPAFTENDPQRVDVTFVHDTSQSSDRVGIDPVWGDQPWGAPPQAMKNALGPDTTPVAIAPWAGHLTTAANVASLGASAEPLPPTMSQKTEESTATLRIVHLHITPPPGARVMRIALRQSSSFVSALIEGRDWPVAELGEADHRWSVLILRAPPAKGTDVTLSVAGSSPLEARLEAVTSGVPQTAQGALARAVVLARPPQASASQDGDSTIVVAPQTF